MTEDEQLTVVRDAPELLRLKPGDILTLKVAIHAAAHEVLAWLEETTPGVRAIVTPEDTKITILRQVKEEES